MDEWKPESLSITKAKNGYIVQKASPHGDTVAGEYFVFESFVNLCSFMSGHFMERTLVEKET